MAIQHAACGYSHTVLVTRSGRLLVFGDNGRGQLGTSASDKPITTAASVYHPKGGRFVSAEAGNAHSILLDSAGDVWLTMSTGMECIISGKKVLAIAAGGDDNCNCIASPPAGIIKRQFSIDSIEDGSKIIDQVESLLEDMDSDSSNKVAAAQDIGRRTEELLKYVTTYGYEDFIEITSHQLFIAFIVTDILPCSILSFSIRLIWMRCSHG